MSKKILAGVLAAASMLSLSVAASADEKKNNESYTITAKVTEGVVDVTFPTSMTAYLNPYNTAVKTGTGATALKNTMGVASEVFELTNNDADEPVKVIASVTVSKALGVTVKDPSLDKTSVKNYDAVDADDLPCVADFDPLVDYNAIKTAVATVDGEKVTKATGGGDVTATQKKNVALWLVADTTKNNVINKEFDKDATNMVAFPTKGTVSATVVDLVAAGGKAYLAINGKTNPEYKGDWDTTGTKDALTLTVILKCMPTVDLTP